MACARNYSSRLNFEGALRHIAVKGTEQLAANCWSGIRQTGKAKNMIKRPALALVTALAVGIAALSASSPAEARWRGGWGWGPGLAAGLVGAAVIGGIASSAYAYGPYGYYDRPFGYYGYGYSPAYAYYGEAPLYYGPRYRRIVRPAYAFYGTRHYRYY
jgi:hypothetical protein